jgi:putative transposase
MAFVRKKNRLSKEIYQKNNLYFVTICVQDRVCIFGDDECRLNEYGRIVERVYLSLTDSFEDIILDSCVVMPNHFHCIIGLGNNPISKFTGKNTDLGKIIKRFKLDSLRRMVESVTDGQKNDEQNLHDHHMDGQNNHNDGIKWRSVIASTIQIHKTVWQKSFYDNVIRGEADLMRIQKYIQNNPTIWKDDILNLSNQQKYDSWIKKNQKN